MSQTPNNEEKEAKSAPKWKKGTEYADTTQPLGAGDSFLTLDLLSPDLEATAFENLKKEVQWKTMYHHGGEVPRLVAVEGEVQPDGW
jgi:hypothetical protein